MTLPTLVLDDGTTLTDTIAICVYLESQYPDKPLFGTNDAEYAQVIGWDHRLFIDGLGSVAEIFRNQGDFFKNRAMSGRVNIPQEEALIARGKLRLSGFWMDLNEALAGKDFIIGDQLTLADIDAFVICSFAARIKEQIPEDCSEILRWHGNVAKLL